VTTVRLFLQGEKLGSQLKKTGIKFKSKIHAAAKSAAEDTVDYVVPRARDDISSAGKFGSKWTGGFKGKVTQGGGFIKVSFTMGGDPPVAYWRVFEEGATIHGKPLLWIPLSFATDAKGVSAKDYPGKLFRVDRKSGAAPLLLAAGKPAVPKYFGKESVTIPKKFHLTEIVQDGAKQLKLFFVERMKSDG
jgi:hypothetical protein